MARGKDDTEGDDSSVWKWTIKCLILKQNVVWIPHTDNNQIFDLNKKPERILLSLENYEYSAEDSSQDPKEEVMFLQ